QGAVDEAGDVAFHHIVQHGDHVGHKLEGVGGVVLVGGGKVRPVERQQTGAAGGRSQAAFHIGVDDIQLFPVAAVEALQQNGADLPGALQGGVLGRVQKALLDGDMVLGKVVAA